MGARDPSCSRLRLILILLPSSARLSAAGRRSLSLRPASLFKQPIGSGNAENRSGRHTTGFSVKDSDVWQNRQHEWRTVRKYQGPVRAVILDWAGTVLDSGVYSPAVVFIDTFEREGVPITMEEARAP